MIYTPTIDEKLKTFNRMIIDDATKSRDSILNQLKDEARRKLVESKAEIDREAAEYRDKEIAKAVWRRESRISKANVNARKVLMAARNDIVVSVLRALTQKFEEFTRTEAYRDYLIENVRSVLSFSGEGGVEIFLTPRDFDRYQAEIGALAPGAALRRGEAAMIGGCRAVNEARGVYVDHSIEKKVEMSVDEFFQISGLRI